MHITPSNPGAANAYTAVRNAQDETAKQRLLARGKRSFASKIAKSNAELQHLATQLYRKAWHSLDSFTAEVKV